MEATLFWTPIPVEEFEEEIQQQEQLLLQLLEAQGYVPPQREQQQQQEQQQQLKTDQQQQQQQEQQKELQQQQQERQEDKDAQPQQEQQQAQQQQQEEQQQEQQQQLELQQSPQTSPDSTRCTTVANEIMTALSRLLFLNGFCVNAPRCFLAEGETIDEYLRQEPAWLAVFTAGRMPYTANLFCSLLSSIFTYDPLGYCIILFVFNSGETSESTSSPP
ncbi:hypothetical protein EMWEY_00052440, partial [Eimeria maxima]